MSILVMRDWVEKRLSARPTLSCTATDPDSFRSWRKRFRARALKALGPRPESVPLEPRVLERTDCGAYVREKVIFESEPAMAVVAWVLTPTGLKKGERRPALLCSHGHHRGKNPVVGLDEKGDPFEDYQHRHGARFAERGYVVIAPDWRGFGERRDAEPWDRKGCAGCNARALAAEHFGFTLLGLQIHDGIRCVDYLQSRPEVDPSRIGVVGVSFGGTMATFLTALEPRIRVGVVSCYLSTIANGLLRGNYCGVDALRDLALYGDIPDVALLAAPKPLLAEVGIEDRCYQIDDADIACERIRAGYRAAGADDRFSVDRFLGGHEFSGRMAFDWFDRWLRR